MPDTPSRGAAGLVDLRGKRGLVIGIANEHSIAAGCAEAFVGAGARLAATYLNAKAEPFVRAVTDRLGCELVLPCDVQVPGQLEEVFDRIKVAWGGLDFLLHSIAFAPRDDLHGRVVDCSAAGFDVAMNVSCHSFIRMAHMAEPLMPNGGCLLAVTFYGSERVVEHYNLMGPVKAALESSMRYVAAELGPKGIRAHAISPGPIRTRPRAVSSGSTSSWSWPLRARRSITWSRSPMSGISRRFSSATLPAGSPGRSFRSTAASIWRPDFDRRCAPIQRSGRSRRVHCPRRVIYGFS